MYSVVKVLFDGSIGALAKCSVFDDTNIFRAYRIDSLFSEALYWNYLSTSTRKCFRQLFLLYMLHIFFPRICLSNVTCVNMRSGINVWGYTVSDFGRPRGRADNIRIMFVTFLQYEITILNCFCCWTGFLGSRKSYFGFLNDIKRTSESEMARRRRLILLLSFCDGCY